jgi:RNA polymerase primary sigma factor
MVDGDAAPELNTDTLGDATTALLAEMPFTELDELRNVVAEGRERGYLTPEEIAAPLEDAEPSREQVVDLHQYLMENGIEIVSEEEARANAQDSAPPAREEIQVPKKVELDLTVEP